ncbi:hypothetical protein DYB38_010434 [Aphanomyces astaci]|uniref:Peptidase M14 domain-containing protein n=1 Tax=Aphanomyces astaci TaxID=112090 RepID=A0A397D5Z8_APHAT|nr:hypothetical protein DYB38_010434 [Aphanomyces astaci]
MNHHVVRWPKTAPGEAETLLAAQVERWKDGIKVLVNQLQRQKTARGLMLENIVRVDDVLLDSGSDVTVVTPGILDALDEAGVVVGIVSHSVPIWRARMAATPSQPDNSSVPTNELSGMVNVKLLMAEKLNPPELDPDNGMECATPEVYPKTSVEVVEAELRRTKQGAIQAILTAKTAKAETRGLAPAENSWFRDDRARECHTQFDGYIQTLKAGEYTASKFFKCFRTSEQIFEYVDALWSAGSSNLYALSSMLDDIVNKKKTAAELFNLYFVPIVNIDGYDISWNSNQLQRKNANEVDLNRN